MIALWGWRVESGGTRFCVALLCSSYPGGMVVGKCGYSVNLGSRFTPFCVAQTFLNICCPYYCFYLFALMLLLLP